MEENEVETSVTEDGTETVSDQDNSGQYRKHRFRQEATPSQGLLT